MDSKKPRSPPPSPARTGAAAGRLSTRQRRSARLTTPTSLSSSSTGRRLIRCAWKASAISRTEAFGETVIKGALMTSLTGRSRAFLGKPARGDCVDSISSHEARRASPRWPRRSPSLTMPTGRSPASSTGTPLTPDSSMSRATEDTGSVARAAIAGELIRSPASRYRALSERWRRGPVAALFETTEKRVKPEPTGLPNAIPAEIAAHSFPYRRGRAIVREVGSSRFGHLDFPHAHVSGPRSIQGHEN